MKEIDCYICGAINQVLKPKRTVYGGLINLISYQTDCTVCGSLLYSSKIENNNIRFARYIIRGIKK